MVLLNHEVKYCPRVRGMAALIAAFNNGSYVIENTGRDLSALRLADLLQKPDKTRDAEVHSFLNPGISRESGNGLFQAIPDVSDINPAGLLI